MALDYTSDSIVTAGDLEHVRMHSGMYGFNIHSNQAHLQCFKEFLDNSCDEVRMLSDKEHVIKIYMIPKRGSYQIIIMDTGRGVPLDKLVDSFTKRNTSGKSAGGAYQASTGIYGVGAKASAALSRNFCAISRRAEGTAIVTVNRGLITHQQIVVGGNYPPETYGTTVIYDPDTSILKCSEKFFAEDGAKVMIDRLLEFLTVLIPNVTFEVHVGSKQTKCISDDALNASPVDVLAICDTLPISVSYVVKYERGMRDYVLDMFNVKSPIVWESGIIGMPMGEYTGQTFGYEIELLLPKDHGKRGMSLLGSVNGTMISKKDAAHVEGVFVSMKKCLVKYIDDADIKNFFLTRYVMPFVGYITTDIQGATFQGQDKNNFVNSEFLAAYCKVLSAGFNKLPDTYWDNLYDILYVDIEEKYHKNMDKGLNVGKGLKNVAFGLSKDNVYVGCRSTDKTMTELFITEGNSAGDFVKQLRDTNTQAIYKLRGKPINPLKCNSAKFNANDIIKDLKKILGTSVTDTTLEHLNFFKIVILTDADNDGYHITALLITILYKINPKIVTRGRVALSNPPLYVLQNGPDTMFIRDKKALMDTKVTAYETMLDVHLLSTSGTKYRLSGANYRDMAYLITRVGNMLEAMGNKHIIEPATLERLAHVIDYLEPGKINTKKIAEVLGLDDCFYQEESNSLVLVYLGAEDIIKLDRLVNEIREYVLPILNDMRWEEITFLVTTLHMEKTHPKAMDERPVSIWTLFELFRLIDKRFHISHMKGLATMKKKQLRETCLDRVTRSFTTLSSAGDVDNIFRIMGVDIAARKALVAANIAESL